MSARSVSVELSVDVSAFVESFRQVAAALGRLHENCRCTVVPFERAYVSLRLAADREEIHQLALVQRGELAAWFDVHVQGVYDDLGLRRPPSNLIRGEE